MNTTLERDRYPAAKMVNRRRVDWGRIGSYLILLIFAVLYLGPLMMLVSTAFKTLPEFFRDATGLPSTLPFVPAQLSYLHGCRYHIFRRDVRLCGVPHRARLFPG